MFSTRSTKALTGCERIEGRKYIILIASGHRFRSQSSRFDKILKKVKESPDITIYTVSTGGAHARHH